MFPSKLFLEDVLGKFDEKNKMNCDVYEKENQIFIEIDMPGFNKENITIELNKGTLNIIAEIKYEEQEEKKYLCRERAHYGKYQRSFYLGEVEEDKIDAKFDNGILYICIPKKQEDDNKRMIEIK